MQQIRQFQDSFKSEYGGGDVVHDVWKRVNPFLRRHASQHAHVIDIDHEPLYPASKESYRIVSVAYSENKARRTKRMLKKYRDEIDSRVKTRFYNHPIDFRRPSRGHDDIKQIIRYVQNHMPEDQAFDHIRIVNISIMEFSVIYTIKCYQDGQKYDATVIYGHIQF